MTDQPPRDDDPTAGLVSALAANGFPRMPAAVLMALMATEDGALTAVQLGERLGVSAAAISGAVRYLETVNMVHRHRRAGSRRFEYELPADAWYTASIAKNELYGLMARMADEAGAQVGPRAAERLDEMAEFFRFVQGRLPEVLVEWNEDRAKSQP
jgi:predicted transcriptional regulator